MGSHDFIRFPPNLQELSSRVWLLLGEVQAKIERIRQIPIPPDESKILRRVYLAKGVHGTTAIEGNTFSEEEVGKIIKNEMKAPPSRQYQEQQIRNMLNAFNTIADDEIRGNDQMFSPGLLNGYHKLVLENLESILSEETAVGELRAHRVEVGSYLAAPPEDCERLMAAYCDWLNEKQAVPAGYELAWQIVKALVAHVYFAWIHPYGDGNGRMARLIEFAILLRAGAPDIAVHLLSNFYNKTRDMYYKQLQDSHGEYRDGSYPRDGNLRGFIEYALQGFKDELDEQLARIHAMQLGVIWHDYIHKSFPKNPSMTQQRQKRLVLDLTERSLFEPIKLAEIRELTPSIALAYANRTERTLRRDLDKLVEMKLLKSGPEGYLPNTDILMGFFAGARIKSD